MTLIDNISFQFKMADEQFVREFYADWDVFCQRCVTDVLEEFFSRYDKKEVYIEIDRLDLDLGGIPQEEFYDSFPVRLREALEREFVRQMKESGGLQLSSPDGVDSRVSLETDKSPSYPREKRFENLLHYLKYGFCLPEWDARDFDLHEELLYFRDEDHAERMLSLIASKPYIMERLFLQTGTERLTEIMPLGVWLVSPTLGQYEKRRYLSMAVKRAPQSVIRLIHETKETGSMEAMAELFENLAVKRIMAAETENHAEIDVPEYWYRLYGWLLEYYPFNGVPMFGDKLHFRLHLNLRLLSFIRKRDYQTYLSKAELTVQFLLEVFGADYYLTVLDIIYHNQRLNADGSPATGDSYAWELYYMLLQLSLIKTRQGKDENADGKSAGEKEAGISPYAAASVALREHIGSFGEWLENTELSDSIKKIVLLRLVKENSELLVQWLKERPERQYISLLADLMDEPSVLLLTGQVSLQLAEAVSAVSEVLYGASTSVLWLKGISSARLTETLRIAILKGIGAGMFHTSETISRQVVQIAGLLYKEITGREVAFVAASSVTIPFDTVADTAGPEGDADDAVALSNKVTIEGIDIPASLREFIGVVTRGTPLLMADGGKIREARIQKYLPNEESSDAQRLSVLHTVLSKGDIPEEVRRMLVLQWLDTYHGKENEAVIALQSEKLLGKVIGLLDDSVLRHVVMRLAGCAFGTGGQNVATSAMQFVGLLVENIREVAVLVSRPVKELWQVLFVSLSSGNSDSVAVAVANNVEFAIRLLSAIAGNDKVKVVVELFISQLSQAPLFIGTSEKGATDERIFILYFGNDALLALLIRMREYIRSGKLSTYISESTYLERDIFKREAEKAIPETTTANPESVTTVHGKAGMESMDATPNSVSIMNRSIADSNIPSAYTTEKDLSIQTDNMDLNEVQMTFEQHLNDISGITGWLRNGAFTSAQKRDVFHRYMKDNPENAMRLVKETVASEENTITLWAEITDRETLSDFIRYTDNTLSGTLTQIMRIVESMPIVTSLFTGSSAERDRSMTKAMLLLVATGQRIGDMDTEEIIRQFLSHWHYVLTGSEEYTATDREQWRTAERQVVDTVASGTPITTGDAETGAFTETGMSSVTNREDNPDEETFDDWAAWLISPSVSDTAKSQMLRHYARWQPKLLWSLVRHSADGVTGKNIPFRRWSGWLGKEKWLEMVAGVSLSLGETLRRITEAVSDKYEVPESALSEGLVRFIGGYPTEQVSYVDNRIIVRMYISALTPFAWKGGIPVLVQEQTGITDSNPLAHGETDKISPLDEQYSQSNTENEITKTDGSIVEKQPSGADHYTAEQQLTLDNIIKEVETRLHIADAEQSLEETMQPQYIEVPNAGLCLLAIWLPRLFGMLGLLTEDRKDLKDTEARVRAIFILQRLMTDEPQEYKEQELAFNRILTGCPFQVPLPKTLELTDNEIQTTESMLSGVKNNWDKLRNTSVKGFQHSFIERPGRLEQREDKWVLYVEGRSYDILLDSLPWSYRLIRLPWLKKKINVVWRDKEEFDF